MKRMNVLLVVGCICFAAVDKVDASSQVACGAGHILAVTASGQAVAWGDNEWGQLGYGWGGNLGYDPNIGYWVFDHSTMASNVVGMDRMRMVAAGSATTTHSLALKEDGTVWSWGYGYFGELGNGEFYQTGTNRPIQVSGLSGVVKIAAGYYFSVALKEDGTVWAWGYNGRGSLGDGTTTWRSTPVQTVGLLDVVDIDTTYEHVIAVRRDGTVWGWGLNGSGQLDSSGVNQTTPIQIMGLSGVMSLAAGSGHSLAIKSDGTLWAWGGNSVGQLGDGTTSNRYLPIQVPGLSNVVDIATSGGHSHAILYDGSVWAWGYNGQESGVGLLGDGTTQTRLSPVKVVSSGAVAIGAGIYNSAVILKDSSLWIVGSGGYGQLGNGQTGSSSTYVQTLNVTALVEGNLAGGYVPNDFDGDGISDIVVQNETSGAWYFQLSSWGFYMTALGQSGRVPVSGDFDGDGRSDPTVCDTASATFYILKSSDNSLSLTTVNSLAGNSPVGGCDFNGDGVTDPTLFDPASGKWYSTSEDTTTTGISGSEPLWGDYDGDGQSDRAAYHPISGQWFAGLSRMEEDLSFTWIPGCEGLNADFDNDNKADPALYHEASGTWYVLLSDADYAYVTLPFGGSGFTPVPGDYDGDGKSDPAVYHEASGYWYRLLSASDYALDTVWFGAPGYKPVK